jgi:DNA gyrase/topoisomerase IV subunit A
VGKANDEPEAEREAIEDPELRGQRPGIAVCDTCRMDERERRKQAEALAETTMGTIDAVSRWREVGEVVASSATRGEAAAALTKPPFSYSAEAARRILDMPMRFLTESGRQELAARMDDIRTYLGQGQ